MATACCWLNLARAGGRRLPFDFSLRCAFAELLAISGLVGYYDRSALRVNKAQASPEEIRARNKNGLQGGGQRLQKGPSTPARQVRLAGGPAVKPWLSASFSSQQLSSLQALLIPPGDSLEVANLVTASQLLG